jgi:hypothetical protein
MMFRDKTEVKSLSFAIIIIVVIVTDLLKALSY